MVVLRTLCKKVSGMPIASPSPTHIVPTSPRRCCVSLLGSVTQHMICAQAPRALVAWVGWFCRGFMLISLHARWMGWPQRESEHHTASLSGCVCGSLCCRERGARAHLLKVMRIAIYCNVSAHQLMGDMFICVKNMCLCIFAVLRRRTILHYVFHQQCTPIWGGCNRMLRCVNVLLTYHWNPICQYWLLPIACTRVYRAKHICH